MDTIKVICRVNGDIITLFTSRTADEIHHAIILHHAIQHRLSAGIGVIVSGEHEVETSFLSCLGKIVMHKCVPCLGICSVGWHMHCQYLPSAGRSFCVFDQPVKGLLVLPGGRIINHRNINISVFDRVETSVSGGWQVIHCLGNQSIYIAIELMVAQNMNQINAIHRLSVEHLR